MNNSSIDQPRFFAKPAVFVFSILLSTFFGALLFAQNLKEIGKKGEIFKVILFAIIWNMFLLKISARFIPNPLISYVIVNGLGGLILIYPYCEHYFKEVEHFEKRKVWGPAVIFIVLLIAIVTYLLVSKAN